MADLWSQLPQHLMDYLLDYVTKQLNLDDLIRFSCVCQRWKSFSAPLLPPKLLPWLIVPYMTETGTTCSESLGFFSFHDRKVYKVDTPEIANHRICGSCQGGWLITLHENGDIQMFHPFSKATISLPQVTKLPGVVGSRVTAENAILYSVPMKPSIGGREKIIHIISTYMLQFYIYKAVRSSTSGIVMVIQGFSRKLAFCRPGKDTKWFSLRGDKEGKFNDITHCNGNFLAVRDNGEVYIVCGLDTSYPFIRLIMPEPNYFMYYKTHLVEFNGELLLLIRLKSDLGPTFESKLTQGFEIKKIDFQGPMWVEEVHDIDKDCALFVGVNNSFALSSSDVPGCRGNCIYFTDDCLEKFMFIDDCVNNLVVDNYVEESFGGHDIGVYNLTDGDVDRFYLSASVYLKPPPVWFSTTSQ